VFLGHFAAGLVASRVEPRLRLGTAFVAAQLPDALWPWFLLAGAERVTIAPGDTAVTPLRFDSYPWSHSLLMVAAWGVAFGLVAARKAGDKAMAALVALLAVSHWLLDAASHRPDMPLVPWGGPKVGLGLWNSLPLTIVVEGALFGGALVAYLRGRRAGPGFWSLIATLAIVYAMNLFGPPPPGVNAIALSMVAVVPLVWLWANRVEVRR
jgi:membrane-bound metal-dependent hydrolase YbcI (DUF457 family)